MRGEEKEGGGRQREIGGRERERERKKFLTNRRESSRTISLSPIKENELLLFKRVDSMLSITFP